jgi:TonB family protein
LKRVHETTVTSQRGIGGLARLRALACCVVAATFLAACAEQPVTPASARDSHPVVTPVRVVRGLNLGNACAGDYPLSSRAAREEGTATLLLHIGADGLVKETRIEVSSGYAALDESAAQCFTANGRFEPQTVDGTPVASWQRIKFTWSLSDFASLPSDKSIERVYVQGAYAAPPLKP